MIFPSTSETVGHTVYATGEFCEIDVPNKVVMTRRFSKHPPEIQVANSGSGAAQEWKCFFCVAVRLRPTALTRQSTARAAAGFRRYARFQLVSAPRSCTRDEGRSLGAGLQEQASNHLKLL
jgi:hypothetical protein